MIGGLPPLQWLLTFRAVMEAGSFAGAAKLLNLTPSAVSHQMRALEGRLQRPLFLRVKRTVVPTEEALAYSASIGESFARLVTATSRVSSGADARRLPIHASPSFATLWLVPRLKQFLRAHPSIDVALYASHEPARLGQDGILVDIQYARPVPESCEAVPLAEELIVPMAGPTFVAEHRLREPGDIARVPLIHSLRCVAPWDQWAARHSPHVPLNPRGLQFDRAHLALAAAADGLGLALESTLQAGDHLRRGELLMPFGALGVPAIAHRLVYRREDRDNPEIMAFLEWITGLLAQERHPDRR
ncbi:LysR substrate-binding domain-containing protein [Enterovirga rhinocerotis]|uniref:LysR family transcriptional regulator n=1 Tax=Enterovirga rhinocerotis TaxID=1339210 RepID=A0A4R7BRZ2_9HYPH|nr:LysR substrate-binding domain-containing protein [Enterovirga rhinocerotis]TDR88161.1 LysR family transcriptional regulator [Enterovirga rhinocerotis]